MSDRDGYEPGVPCWVAAAHRDPERAVAFYGELLGWEARDLVPSTHFEFRLRGRRVAAIVPEEGERPAWLTHVWVDDVDAVAAQAVEAGGEVTRGPSESPAGARMALLTDPAGAAFSVWQPGEHRGAEVVNEPVLGPYDVPGFRQAVLADPGGAAFTVSARAAPPG